VDYNEDLDLSQDGRRLLAVHMTGSARIIDTSNGRTVVRIPGSELPDERMFTGAAAIFSPDEESVVTKAGWDNLVRVWDAATGRLKTQLEGHSGGVTTVEYDREGRLLATRALDETARIWSATSGDPLVVLRNADKADLSPDGRRILVQSRRTRIHRCDVCGDLDDLLALAKRRVSRDFTAAERARYLHE
jgi:WD40 repeat protein